MSGSRQRNSQKDYDILLDCICHIFKKYQEHCNIVFVSGGATRGADHFIKTMSVYGDLELIEFCPKLDSLPPSPTYHQRCQAYYDRNLEIAKKSDLLIALPSVDRKGRHRSNNKIYDGIK